MPKGLIKVNSFGSQDSLPIYNSVKCIRASQLVILRKMIAAVTCQNSWAWRSLCPWSAFNLIQCALQILSSLYATENFLISKNSVFFTWKFDIIDNYFNINSIIPIKFIKLHNGIIWLGYGIGSCNKETKI